MLKIEVEKRLATIAAGGAAAVTLLVTDRVSTEPVNVGKMVLLSVVAFASFSLVLPQLRSQITQSKRLAVLGVIFLTFGLISIFVSSNPWVKGFYGTFGRNTGFLTYLSLFLILFSVALCRREQSFKVLIWALYVAGFVNILVSVIDLMGGKIFTWDNPFGNVLGTFGNTNFISSFMGIFVSALAAFALKAGLSILTRLFLICIILLGVFVTIQTNSLQGLVLIAVGFSIVTYFYIASQFKKRILNIAFLVAVSISATLGLLGTLQIGPLKEYLYKPSVSFRGEYWASGIRMGLDHLFSGVGFDSYGAYYRIYRDSSALVSPGVNVATDTAHNVFIDIFAGIGLFGFIAYVLILALVLRAAFKVIRTRKSYDYMFVALFTAWATYQVQSIISINQIGLAVWGWILGGAIIGYSQMETPAISSDVVNKIPQKTKFKNAEPSTLSASSVLMLVAFSTIGLLISIPPFLADAKMRSAITSNQGEQVAKVAKSWPLDSFRLNRAAVAFANAGIIATAIELSEVSIKNFPEDYLGWFALYQLTPVSDSKREIYLKKLHELDPLNPEFMKSK
jgi:O-antigen ligase